MKGSSKINHRPYMPINQKNQLHNPYICRLAPTSDGAQIEWFDYGCSGGHTLFYGERSSENKTKLDITDSLVEISGLKKDQDYEFYIESESGLRSKTRLFRTGDIPDGCTVINYLHPDDKYYDVSGQYLGSPSIVRLKSGKLIASMDVFGPRTPQNLSLLFSSEDNGKTWRYLTDIYPMFWGMLFYHRDTLYMLGVTTEYGNLHIISSCDEGVSWSEPTVIFYGSNLTCLYGGIHRGPMQMVKFKGRFYTSCEYGCWEYGSHLPAVLSVDENADFMKPENWTLSEIMPFDGLWQQRAVNQGDTIEGNIVLAPDGNLYNYMRWKIGSILKLRVNTAEHDKMLEFEDIVDAPVSNSMFRIISADDRYLLITNRKTEKTAEYDCHTYRNVLSLYESKDLESFTLALDIINREDQNPDCVGFQYPAVLYENGEIYLVIRSAFNNPNSAHNSNYMLFRHI
ncbi:MAG: exo-alpha-sialidase [Clostridia bacterium]|nr:exo-alpha-sialidase [Clostridia bacterium]